MKSRYKKHIQRIEKRSPIIAFSKDENFKKGDILQREELPLFNQHISLVNPYTEFTNYKKIKEEMIFNLILFTDNYLSCGGNEYVYLLIPLKNGKCQVVEKESIYKWACEYWKKVDPHNNRNWAYFDEDISGLFDYMMSKYDEHNK